MAGIEPRGRESDEGTGLRRDEHGSGAPRTAGEKGRGQDEAQGRWQVQAGEWQAACPQPPAMRRAHLDQVEVLLGRVVQGVEVEDARLLLFGWLGHRRLRALLLVVGEGDGVAGRGARLGRLAGCPSRRFCSRRLCDLLLLLLVVVLHLLLVGRGDGHLRRLRPLLLRMVLAARLVVVVVLLRVRVGLGR